jgi:hypothetical protein
LSISSPRISAFSVSLRLLFRFAPPFVLSPLDTSHSPLLLPACYPSRAPVPNSRSTGRALRYTFFMEKKVFWMTFTLLGLIADLALPFWWAVGATIPLLFASWWIAYRSGWF